MEQSPMATVPVARSRHIASSVLTRLCALQGTDAERYQAAIDLIAGATAASARVRA
jgi:hypothetical protein